MAKLAQLAAPMVGRSTSLHANNTGWKRLKEGKQLRAFYGPIEDDPAILRNAVNLKYIFEFFS